ncbi:Phage capsid family protein [Prauserella aidingensis]|uniref:phage major capsid family protein n=1 Tax=Prauserella aidingensis TaxID=387890 RepID=UPI0020A5126E|nr:phage major capsid protein [Prauserella aidingensis]MCP2255084.1 Phage capsid family protein [Prauserella aidingensis]
MGTETSEVERERLIVEARQLLADAGGDALDEQATTRFSEIEHQLDRLRDEQDQRPGFVDPTARPLPGDGERRDPLADYGVMEGVPSLTPTRSDMAGLFRAASQRQPLKVGTPALSFATVGTADAGSSEQWAVRENQPVSIRRLAEFAALGSETVDVGSRVTFPVFGDGSATTADEGSAKGEYDNITSGDASPKIIAAWTDVTMQLRSMGGFEGRLRRKLSALIARREDELLITTALGTDGIQTHTAGSGESKTTSVLAGATMVVDSAVGADPDVIVMNPEDVVDVFDGSVGMSGESPENALRLTLHGLRVYPSSAVGAGTALVGSWRAASQLVVGLSPTFMVDPYSQMKNNIVTILGEEAVNLAVDEPDGFAEITFDTA